MDEDEMTRAIESQLQAEEEFGLSSYASFQVPAPSNQARPDAKTAKALQEAIYSDSEDDEDDEDGEVTEETSSAHTTSELPASTHSSHQVSHSTSSSSPGSTPPSSSFIPTFVSTARSTAPRSTPLISAARARATSNMDPLSSAPPMSSSAPASTNSVAHDESADSEPPPLLGTPPDLPPPRIPPPMPATPPPVRPSESPAVLKPVDPTAPRSFKLPSASVSRETVALLEMAALAAPPPSLALPPPGLPTALPPPLAIPPSIPPPSNPPPSTPPSHALPPTPTSDRPPADDDDDVPPPRLQIPPPLSSQSAPVTPLSPRDGPTHTSGPSASSAKTRTIRKSTPSSGSSDGAPRKAHSHQLPNRKGAGSKYASGYSGGPLSNEMYLQSPQSGTEWLFCESSLVGNQLRWVCRQPECYGVIELDTINKVTRVKQNLEHLPAGTNAYSLTSTAGEVYHMGLATYELALLWRDAVVHVRKSKKSKQAPVSIAALQTIKMRMDHLANITSTATFNLIRLFFHGKYTFVKAIFSVIQVTEADKLAGSLARMFFYADMPLKLIKSVIEWEVEKTTIVNQLFRQDSMASKIMTAYTRLIAQPYLVATLKTSVTKIAKGGEELEVNPDFLKADERDLVGARAYLLQSNITDLLTAIRDSVLLVPTECRLICSFLNEAVMKKFSDRKATDIALAGYLFLRLINSAIIFPDSIGIIDKAQITPSGRRALTLVSKVILNMANQVEFNKEPYLLSFNPYLREKLPILQEFLHTCSTVPEDSVLTATNVPASQLILDELAVVYKLLHPLQDKLFAALESEPRIQKRMKQAFVSIGVPPATTVPALPAPDDAKKDKGKDKEKEKDKDKHKKDKEPEKKAPLPPELMHFVSKSAVY